jgi:hypothetical protein
MKKTMEKQQKTELSSRGSLSEDELGATSLNKGLFKLESDNLELEKSQVESGVKPPLSLWEMTQRFLLNTPDSTKNVKILDRLQIKDTTDKLWSGSKDIFKDDTGSEENDYLNSKEISDPRESLSKDSGFNF